MVDIENELDFELHASTRHEVLEDQGITMDWMAKNCNGELDQLRKRMATLKTDSVITAAYSIWCEYVDEDDLLGDVAATRLMVVAILARDKKVSL